MKTKPQYGHVSVETALVLVAITAGILYAAMHLGSAAKNTLTQASTAALAMQPAEVDDLKNPSLAVDENSTTASFWRNIAIAGGWIAIGAGVSICIFRRRSLQVALELPAPENLSVSYELKQSRLFEKRQNVMRILSRDALALFEGRMTVGQLMSTHVRSVGASATITELKQLCRDHKIRHLLVCDNNGQLVGIVSDRDLTVKTGQVARDIMTPDPMAVTTGTLVGPAMTMLLDHRFHCLPVVDAGVPCGVLTSSDLLIALQCALQLLAKTSASIRTQ